MLFNSFAFLFVFLPLALLFYYLPARCGRRDLSLIALSLLSLGFYGYWEYQWPGSTEPRRMYGFVALLVGSTTANYLLGVMLQRARRPWLLGLGIAANLGVLFYFKYRELGVETIAALTGLNLPVAGMVLPLAISFYTFTQIAFLVDAHRGLAAEMSYWRYCLFVFFFPHLIAGPIVHHSEIMPQFARPEATRWNVGNFCVGLTWLSIGLFKKVAIADACAPYANEVFGLPAGGLTILEAWTGALAYTMQLYFDFSGYSDMAIGLSWMFNVRLPDNFDAPYRARNIIEFWRRWHMTLSRFLREYLYIPLGGNRLGPARRYRNLIITMALGGLWHGAGWNFLAWGVYHGMLLAVCHQWARYARPLPEAAGRALTFVAVVLGWVLFRARDLHHAGEIFRAMFSPSSFRLANLPTGLQLDSVVFLVALVIFVNLAPTTKHWIESRQLRTREAIAAATLFSLALLIMRDVSLNFGKSEFIYFQF